MENVDKKENKEPVLGGNDTIDIRGPVVNANTDLPAGQKIEPRVVKTGILGGKKKKKTFQDVIEPLSGILRDLKSFITGRATEIRDNRYIMEQLRLEIEADLREIDEAEGSVEFIQQVIDATKKKK